MSCAGKNTQALANINIHSVWAAIEPDLKTELVMQGNPSVDFDF